MKNFVMGSDTGTDREAIPKTAISKPTNPEPIKEEESQSRKSGKSMKLPEMRLFSIQIPVLNLNYISQE